MTNVASRDSDQAELLRNKILFCIPSASFKVHTTCNLNIAKENLIVKSFTNLSLHSH